MEKELQSEMRVEKKSLFALVGAVLSAVLASFCCWGPLLFVSLGIGGAAVSTWFGRFHWVWIFFAFGMWTWALIRYIKNKKQTCSGACQKTSKGKMLFIFGGSFLLILAFVFFPFLLNYLG